MTSPIITEAVRALVDRRDLTRIEAAAAMEAIMSGGATNAQIESGPEGRRIADLQLSAAQRRVAVELVSGERAHVE